MRQGICPPLQLATETMATLFFLFFVAQFLVSEIQYTANSGRHTTLWFELGPGAWVSGNTLRSCSKYLEYTFPFFCFCTICWLQIAFPVSSGLCEDQQINVHSYLNIHMSKGLNISRQCFLSHPFIPHSERLIISVSKKLMLFHLLLFSSSFQKNTLCTQAALMLVILHGFEHIVQVA